MVTKTRKVNHNLTKRGRLDLIRSQLEMEYSSFKARHRELLDFFAPYRGRFTITEANRGTRKNQRIINTHALNALSILKQGLMASVTNPSIEWVRLTVDDKRLAESGAVKDWLNIVTKDMNSIFLKSNLYRVLPTVYGDMGVVATGAMWVEEDFDDVVRFYSLPIGSYTISANAKGRVDTVIREFRMTVRQLVEKFGFEEGQPQEFDNIDRSKFSTKVLSFWDLGEHETWVDVVHVILPNEDFNPNRLEAKFKKYASFYYERGTGDGTGNGISSIEDASKFLSESGFDLFPILVPRWETTGEDAWGTNCPAIKAEGRQRAIQTEERRLAQADELGINPPMNYPTSLRKKGGSALPGAKNYVDIEGGNNAIRPTMEITFDKGSIVSRIERGEDAIDELFHRTAFLAISGQPIQGTPPSAAEINARLQESRLMLIGTVINIQDDLLEPIVDITFARMQEQGKIPPAPEELQGLDLKVEFIGVLAQAQKSISLGSMQTFYNDVGQVAALTQDPTVWDKVNTEQLIDELAEAAGVTPSIIVSDEEVDFIKEQRAAAEQAVAQQEAIQSLAGSAKDLSQTDLSGDNALTALAENAAI